MSFYTHLPKSLPSPYASLLDILRARKGSVAEQCLGSQVYLLTHPAWNTWGSLGLSLSLCLSLYLSVFDLSIGWLSYMSIWPSLICPQESHGFTSAHTISPGYPEACLRDRTHFLPLDGRCDKECLAVFHPFTDHLPCSDATSNPVMIFFNPPSGLVADCYPFCRGKLKCSGVR